MAARLSLRRGIACLLMLLGVGVWFAFQPEPERDITLYAGSERAPLPPARIPAGPEPPDREVRPPTLPSGAPPAISCRQARRIVAQVGSRLASSRVSVSEERLARSTTSWLDPHGLWAAAPDAPGSRAVIRASGLLLSQLKESERGSSGCIAAEAVGAELARWVERLRIRADTARQAKRSAPATGQGVRLLALGFEDDPVRTPSTVQSQRLGTYLGEFATLGSTAARLADTAFDRLFPQLSAAQWSEVVLAALVRAYVPLMDAHGQWVPHEEESTLYASDPSLDAGPRLWLEMERTPLGPRVVQTAVAEIRAGEIVVEIGGIATAGMSVEQLQQLSMLHPIGAETKRSILVFDEREADFVRRNVPLEPSTAVLAGLPELSSDLIPYANRAVLVIRLPTIGDLSGDAVAALIAQASASVELAGTLLDLRGNAGGSMEGAARALGIFLPVVPSFPLVDQVGRIDVDHVAAVPQHLQYSGPVAALVDSQTASAAEMIAGALQSYRRGPVLGARTFGKGCVQEYFEDRAGAGVLRLTTMLFSLPDGEPVQRVGILPTLPLALPAAGEREADLLSSPPSWRGPDVREQAVIGGAVWPVHTGRFGPCQDVWVCRALDSLGKRARASRPAPAPRLRGR